MDRRRDSGAGTMAKMKPLRPYGSKMESASKIAMTGYENPGNRGFTLLELLISLTLLSVIAVLVFGALRLGVRAWEKGEATIETRQRERIVMDLLQRQMASMAWPVMVKDPGGAFAFRGDEKSLSFLSSVALVPGNEYGMVYAKYEVREEEEGDRESLFLFEKNRVFLPDPANPAAVAEEDFHELLPGFYRISFAYLKQGEEGPEPQWQSAWDPEMDGKAPLAVRVSLTEEESLPPVTVVARVTVDTG